VTWFFAVLVVGVLAAGVLAAIARLRREIPRVVEVIDSFGRDLQPALVRVRSSADELRRRQR
jgi:hypothetical protein